MPPPVVEGPQPLRPPYSSCVVWLQDGAWSLVGWKGTPVVKALGYGHTPSDPAYPPHPGDTRGVTLVRVGADV